LKEKWKRSRGMERVDVDVELVKSRRHAWEASSFVGVAL
jgi:hypothetical protein